MVLLENDAFLSEVTKLFQKSKATSTGSLCITMKRYDGRKKPKPQSGTAPKGPIPAADYKCLMRAALGSKKVSTVINAKDVNKFQMAYANLLRANMDALKKREKKSKKAKTT